MTEQNCKSCGDIFEITDDDLEFYNKISPIFDGKKHNIPSPTLCPDCRLQRRLAWRNERKLYRRNCDATSKNIISLYSADKNYKVYHQDYWWSDNWDAINYGKDFDFSKPFFQQFDELLHLVPQMGLLNSDNENCDYNNYILGARNCYMSFLIYQENEDIYYSHWIVDSKNIYDCNSIYSSSLCYDSTDCNDCYNISYSDRLSNCSNSSFLLNCKGCENCFGSVNLINKQYCFFNEQLTKEEYEDKINNLNIDEINGLEEMKQKFKTHCLQFPYVSTYQVNSEDCSGNNIKNSKNVKYGFDVHESEDCKCIYGEKMKDCMDGIGGSTELSYEFSRSGFGLKNYFTFDGIQSNDVYYCSSVYNCNNCFGCIGLRNKEYCIFNKQYKQDEYEKIVSQIIEHMMQTGEWGEFFPINISPFGYNETVANDHYTLNKEETTNKGFKWQDNEYPINIPENMPRINVNDLPKIKTLSDEEEKKILSTAIICEKSGKPFRIIQQELDFYKKYNIPLPSKHHDIRYIDRVKRREPKKLYNRNCDKCGINIETTYSPARPETVFCEDCYIKEIY